MRLAKPNFVEQKRMSRGHWVEGAASGRLEKIFKNYDSVL